MEGGNILLTNFVVIGYFLLSLVSSPTTAYSIPQHHGAAKTDSIRG